MRMFQCDLRFVERLSFSEDGQRLQALGTKRVGSLTDFPAGRSLTVCGHEQTIQELYDYPGDVRAAISVEGWHAIASEISWDTHIDIFLPGQRSSRSSHHRPKDIATSHAMSFSPSGHLLAIGFTNQVHQGKKTHGQSGLCLWQADKRQEIWRFPTIGRAAEIVFSPDERHLAIATDRRAGVCVLDFVDRGAVAEPVCDDCPRVAFSPNGSLFATAGHSVTVWTTTLWERVSVFRGQDEDLPGLAFSPDERILAVARSDGPAEFWDVESGQLRRSYNWDIGRLSAIAFSPDGLTCAVAGSEGRIVVWDVD